MYDLLIVDDEPYMREGIKSTYDWNSYGFQVVDTAENGREALEIIRIKRPHVVLTDIVMPEMDGLEFMEQVNRLYPEVNVVLVSAHSNFKYAHKAISHGVKGYLLKPIDEIELEVVFNSLREQLIGNVSKETKSQHAPIEFEYSNTTDNNYISRAKQYVMDNYEKRITLEEVSRYLYITAGYFGFIFKKETGCNFIDYIVSVKLDRAKHMLRHSDYKVKEISLRIGYDDYTYFCKIFKKIEGCTPLEYRSMN